MFCKFCGSKLLENSRFCHKCGKDNAYIPNESKGQANTYYVTPSPLYNRSQNKKFGLLKIFGIIAGSFFGLLVLIIILFGFFIKSDKTMKIEDPAVLAYDVVSASGGTLTVTGNNSLNGLSVEIPEDAYDLNQNFVISSSEIKSHNFGKYFNPITPLITIDNGHAFAQIPMTVSIPISKESDEFAMAFYYDRIAGRFEAIPFISLTNDNITIVTSHFSDIVVSKIKQEEINKMAFSTENKIDTGFTPGLDDWQFINYGSFIAPKGHCGGQAITMSWYYTRQFKEKNQPRLFGRYDNTSFNEKTPDFWYDDSQGYRFASAIQRTISWEKVNEFLKLRFKHIDSRPTFNAFAYSMLLTGEPQLMAIFKIEDGKYLEGHAITVYKIENGKIYVADPNYPGQKDRFIEAFLVARPNYDDEDNFFEGMFTESEENGSQSNPASNESKEQSASESETNENLFLKNYSSGANAADIKEKGNTLYNSFNFMGQSAIVDYSKIETEFNNMLNRAAADDKMPTYNIYYLTEVDPKDSSKRTFTKLLYDLQLNKGYDDLFPEELKGKIVFMVNSENKSIVVDVFRNMKSPSKLNDESLEAESDGNIIFALELGEGENYLGLLISGILEEHKSPKFIDFNWIKVDYSADEKVDNPTPTSIPSFAPQNTVLSQGSGPKNYDLGPPTFVAVTSGDAKNNDRISITVYKSEGPATSVPAHKITYEEEDALNRSIIIEISCTSAQTYMGYYGGSVNNLGYQNWRFEDNKLIGFISLREGRNVDVKISMEKDNFIAIDFIGNK